MRTTFKAILASELLAVCSETTERQRIKPEQTPVNKFSKEEIKNMLGALPTWNGDARNQLMKAFSILLRAPELDTGKVKGVFDLFSVVVCDKNENNHPWPKKVPFIIVHSNNQFGLGPSGDMNAFFKDNDKPRLATSAEIVTCIESLSEAQWNTVMINALFSPIVATAMNRRVVLDENEVILSEADMQAAEETP